MVNRCSQTEEPWCQYLMPVSDQKSHTFDNFGDVDRRIVYNVANNPTKSHEKSHSTSGNHEKGESNGAFVFHFSFFFSNFNFEIY